MLKFRSKAQPANTLRRTDRASLTAVNELLQNGTSALIALLITPYIARRLGFEQYGVWLMVFQLLGYVTWADLSPGSALKLSLITRQHEEDSELKRRIISASLIVALTNFPIYVLGWLLLYQFMPLLLKNTMEWVPSARMAMTVLLLGGFLANFFSVFSNVLRAMNSAFKAMGLRSFVLIGFGMAQVLVVEFGLGMPGLAALRILGDLVMAVLLFHVARKSFSWFGFSRPTRQDVIGLLKFSPWLFLYSLGYTLFQSSDLLISGWILGPTVAAAYSLTRTLPLLTDRWLRPLVLSTTAGMGDLYGRGEIAHLAEVRVELHLIVIFLASIFGALALALNKSFVGLWIGHGQYAGDVINMMLVLAIIFSLFSISDLSLLDISGHLPQRMMWYTASGLSVALFSTLFVYRYGIIGAAGGILLGQLILLFGIQMMVFRHLFNTHLFVGYLRALLRPLLVTGVIYLCSFLIGRNYPIESWLHWVITAILIGAIVIGGVWILGFNVLQRAALQGRILSPIQEWIKRTKIDDGASWG